MSDEMWINGQGHHVPASMVSDADKMKEELVNRLHAGADATQAVLAAFKKAAFDEVYAARELLFEKYGAKVGGAKGNFTITNFAGTKSVEVKVSDRISFGPELQAAKALIDEFVEENAEGVNDNARVLLEHAFQVNKAGRIDTNRVLGLRKLQIKGPDGGAHPKWEAAMQAITDALQINGTSTYLLFKEADERGVMVTKSLDFAAL
ncbi:DUF3164 family protein [Gemmobacter serpentinus]|uniref:DUF3164 family protein n=1 Tax=Gemmobacter serpentinus TaxID=2652247 RepID=UPI00124BDE53|nr:DUF3164 family protein [Gemmobacter serpentinus]